MKATTLKNKLEKLSVNKNLKAYSILLDVINNTNNTYMVYCGVIRPVTTSGSGRFCTNLDYTNDVKSLLDALKVKYIAGNDAKRGGLTGNFIKIVTKITY